MLESKNTHLEEQKAILKDLEDSNVRGQKRMAEIKRVFGCRRSQNGSALSDKTTYKVDSRWQKDPRELLSDEMKLDYKKNFIAENISLI